MKKILITGGPVHAHLDAVKIITNRFKGGLMAELAERLSVRNTEITFLCTAGLGAKKPTQKRNLLIREHAGFEDYRRLVLEMAPEMDAIVLGAAVANLIPLKPFKGKTKVVVIQSYESITKEAQNALLKVLEEPPANTLIIILTLKKEFLLPTILSRCKIINLKEEN